MEGERDERREGWRGTGANTNGVREREERQRYCRVA